MFRNIILFHIIIFHLYILKIRGKTCTTTYNSTRYN